VTVRAELRFLDSPDTDLQAFAPAVGEPFSVVIDMYVGPSSERGEELFQVVACNLAWLQARLDEYPIQRVDRTLVVEAWNYHDVEQLLRRTVNAIEDTSWERVALRVGEIGMWEFYNYREGSTDAGDRRR
jgi:hypothetical protein